ncbi:hypothetical protein CRX72_13960 [Pantoea sp. BRM17]|nr:hypothetical protein CRX72_13960 [Pantoea sp. BRM17]
MRYLLDQGYEVIPVSPKLAGQQLMGQTAYASLAEIPGKVDMVDVFRNAEAAWEVAQDAIGALNLHLNIFIRALAQTFHLCGLRRERKGQLHSGNKEKGK